MDVDRSDAERTAARRRCKRRTVIDDSDGDGDSDYDDAAADGDDDGDEAKWQGPKRPRSPGSDSDKKPAKKSRAKSPAPRAPAAKARAASAERRAPARGIAEPAQAVEPPPGAKLTPLEQQVAATRAQHPGTVLAFEVGYKYKFYGRDAETAASVLRVAAYTDHHYLAAMVPATRVMFHVRRLVRAGHRVGLVKQTEVAAVKALSDSRSKPFARSLAALYTPATLLSADDGAGDDAEGADANYMLCLDEGPRAGAGDAARWAMAAVDVATGDVVYERAAADDAMRSALENALGVLCPSEIVARAQPSERTAALLRRLERRGVRVEYLDADMFDYDGAVHALGQLQQSGECGPLLALEREVVCCVGALLRHLAKFSLEGVLKLSSNLRRLTSAMCMSLPASTVANLELFENNVDHTEKGSLFWLLAHTTTGFGRRLLRRSIRQRLDAVQEILEQASSNTAASLCILSIRKMLLGLPDLEKGICRVHNRLCSPREFVRVMQGMRRVAREFPSREHIEGVRAHALRTALEEVPEGIADTAERLIDAVSPDKAERNEWTGLLSDSEQSDDVRSHARSVADVEVELEQILGRVRTQLRRPALEYTHMVKEQYLIELPLKEKVPSSWIKVNYTQSVSRWRTDEMVGALERLEHHRALLDAASREAWFAFLSRVSVDHYVEMHLAVRSLAVLDALNALAVASSRPGFARPEIVGHSAEGQVLSIVDGRNPVAEALSSEAYVANSIELGTSDNATRCAVITGPNMGGKSSFTRQVALIAIMAQVGCYVPAAHARLTPLDAVYTRMGASDAIERGQSTYFVELAETSQILRGATSRSLVVLDELGRGTSTHDGTAIAYATVRHLLATRCLVLFVTHYGLLAETLEAVFPVAVQNLCMSFMQNQSEDGTDEEQDRTRVTFLYKITGGIAPSSFGLNQSNPVLHWPFEGPNATSRLWDWSGNGFTATVGGGIYASNITWAQGVVGSHALQMLPTWTTSLGEHAQGVACPYLVSPLLKDVGIRGMAPFTLAMWIKPDLPVSSTSARASWVASLGTVEAAFTRGSVATVIRPSQTLVAGAVGNNLPDTMLFHKFRDVSGEWMHVAASYEGTFGGDRMSFYVNGRMTDIIVIQAQFYFTARLYVGNTTSSTQLCYSGLVDDVRLYNRPLSGDEVYALWSGPCDSPGRYVPAGARMPGTCEGFACAAGTTDDDGDVRTACVGCSAGQYAGAGTQGPCTACQSHTTDADSDPATPCVACGAGHYVPGATGSSGPCSGYECGAGWTDADSDAGTACEQCGAGAYVPAGSAGACGLYQCAAGTVDDDGDAGTPCVEACTLAATPAACNSTAGCAWCWLRCWAAGPSCNPGCPAGTTAAGGSATAPCAACGAGAYAPAGSMATCAALACAAGTTDDDGNASTACVACGAGHYVAGGSTGACSVHVCGAGWVDNDSDAATACVQCGSGVYVPPGSQGACSDYACGRGLVDADGDASTACVSACTLLTIPVVCYDSEYSCDWCATRKLALDQVL
eukprot:m51a1_g8955 putative dna mismatch repair protein msh3 (1513) ;mRNA; r:1032663-1038614